jgi:type II secretory pathway component GspD/PulD (secretin)
MIKYLFVLFISISSAFSIQLFPTNFDLRNLAIFISQECNKNILISKDVKNLSSDYFFKKEVSCDVLFDSFLKLVESKNLYLNKENGFYIITNEPNLHFFKYSFKNKTSKSFNPLLGRYKKFCSLDDVFLFCNAPLDIIDKIKLMLSFYDVPLPIDPYKNKTVDISLKIIESSYNDLLTLKNELSLKGVSNPLNLSSSAKDSLSLSLDMFLNGASVVDTLSLSYFFEYLQTHDISKVINEPRILVTNSHETTITSGGTTRVINSTTKNDDLSATTTTYSQLDIGLQITVKAKIINKNKCSLTISLNNENVTGGTAELPITSKQFYSTTLTIDKDETIIIGGVLYEKNTHVTSKIPFLGDIPIFGIPFKSENTLKEKKVLTIALTVKDYK